jgi:hypothetical protein
MHATISCGHCCPRCGSDEVHESSRRGFARLLSLLSLLPFRCFHCGARFWRFDLVA